MQEKKGFRGDRLKEARERLNMKQKDLAIAVGIDTDSDSGAMQISRYENGHHRPLPDILQKFAGALNVSVDWLLGRTDDPTGTVTVDSLPPDEIEVLNAYRRDDLDTYIRLGIQKHDKSVGYKPGES